MLDFSITFFFTFINIGILFFILRAILFKPLTKFMEARAKKIQASIEQAERDKNQARLLRQQYEDQLKNAQNEAETIINAARETAREEAARIIAQGKQAAETLLLNARKQNEAEQRAALALFKAEAAALVVAASSRLLKRELTGEDNLRFAQELLRDLGKQ
ncbi:MAG: F0F1 ATP synthase subunit B [Treponema sp.]|jgi:F-type H+-transporting ATPase subunit b|nr:F0F1 ATP synthase subunit B [Treponema sp.]